MVIYLMPSCACAWYCSAVLDFSLIQIFNLNSITFLILHIIQHTSLYFPKYLILITFSNVYLRKLRNRNPSTKNSSTANVVGLKSFSILNFITNLSLHLSSFTSCLCRHIASYMMLDIM